MHRSEALQYIEQLSEKGKLEVATHRYALIFVDLISKVLQDYRKKLINSKATLLQKLSTA